MEKGSSNGDPRSPSDGGGEKKRPAPSSSTPLLSSGENKETADSGTKRAAVADPRVDGGAYKESPSLVDVCDSVGLKPGDRVEVMWDVHFAEEGGGEGGEDGGKEGENDLKSNDAAGDEDDSKEGKEPEKKAGDADTAGAEDRSDSRKVMRWWGATLLLHDGRSHVLSDEDGGDAGAPISAALRVLDYDPYVEGGFPDRSLEEVVFLSDRSILNVSSGTRAHWRREGDSWEPGPEEEFDEDGVNAVAETVGAERGDNPNENSIVLPNPQENFRAILDNVMVSSLEKTGCASRMKSMSAAERAIVAEKIARTKEAMLEKLVAITDTNKGIVVTAEHVQRCLAELGQGM